MLSKRACRSLTSCSKDRILSSKASSDPDMFDGCKGRPKLPANLRLTWAKEACMPTVRLHSCKAGRSKFDMLQLHACNQNLLESQIQTFKHCPSYYSCRNLTIYQPSQSSTAIMLVCVCVCVCACLQLQGGCLVSAAHTAS